MAFKKFHKQLIPKLKTALREARDCFVFCKELMRRTVELNYIPFARHRTGVNCRPVPTGNILPNLRVFQYSKNNNPLQEGAIIDAYRHAVPQLTPCTQYSITHNTVKSANIIIPTNETREVVDVTTAEHDGEFPAAFTIRAEKNARVTYVLAVFGNREITKDITLELEEGGEGKIIGVILATREAKYTIKTTLHHIGEHTKGDIKIKVVLKDKACVYYDGMIKIAKTANQTNSYLSGKALALNRGVCCDAKPELEIEANDVKASHSFSQGQIDEEQLFYLQSRGLTVAQAKQMIVEGFLMEAVKDLSKETQEKIISNMTLLNK